MTNDKTVTMSRDLAERLLSYGWFNQGGTQNGIDLRLLDRNELAALLAAPAVERQPAATVNRKAVCFIELTETGRLLPDGTKLYASPPEPVAVVMSFDFEHPLSKERRTVSLTKRDVYDGMEDYFYDKLGEQICQCESVGETNVVDCNCDEYIHDFELVADTACLDKVKEMN